MKNKKVVYFLLVVVVFIWGVIFYRIYTSIGGPDNVADSGLHNTLLPDSKNEVDTFSISGNYRDPFLGIIVSEKPVMPVSKAPIQQLPKVEKIVVNVPWPSVGYSGMIKNQKSNKQFVLMEINGVQTMMKAGDVVQGLTLNKIYRDSVNVTFQKEKRTIRK